MNIKEPPETTFLEIIGKSHIETTWSRILAFFLDPKQRHGMKDLMLRSLFESIDRPFSFHSIRSYQVHTEYPTKEGRIDLVIESSDFVIGIENKVNALLYNNLVDYATTINNSSQKRKSYLIVLSKNNADVKEDVKEKMERLQVELLLLTYEKFLASIRRNIGFYHSHAETRYFIFFLDFIDNIEKNLHTNIYMLNDQETMKFFINNFEGIKKLSEKTALLSKEKNIAITQLDNELRKDTQWIQDITSL
ncbi:MAG: PD-(D/E)XK nuclease family protein [Bacteroidales bacterium]|nr:PD-(D/E)XK nuclease family protein [Bacteroidales bacterium]